jgi:thiamine-monophosphate kinase
MTTSIAALGEHALIERLRQRVTATPPHIEIGIGDDAAAIAPERGTVDVVTTDSLVEGVHFRRDWTRPAAIGHKALAVNVSDLAAMGAMPRASLLSLALPSDLPVADFDELIDGFVALAGRCGAALAGGNISRSPGPLMIDVVAIGSARRRRLLRRDTARPGDDLYVSGSLGGAAAGLALLSAGEERAELTERARAAVSRYERPEARWRLGLTVARTRSASAAMDVSDGLAATARAIAEASGAGVVIEGDAVPVDPAAADWTARGGGDPVLFALGGGEDYELAFAVPPRLRTRFLAACRRAHGLAVTRVGRFVREPGAWLSREGETSPLPSGFTHF